MGNTQNAGGTRWEVYRMTYKMTYKSVSEADDTLARNRRRKPTSEKPAPVADANILGTSALF